MLRRVPMDLKKNHNGRKKQGHCKIRCGTGDTKASKHTDPDSKELTI